MSRTTLCCQVPVQSMKLSSREEARERGGLFLSILNHSLSFVEDDRESNIVSGVLLVAYLYRSDGASHRKRFSVMREGMFPTVKERHGNTHESTNTLGR